MNDHPATEFWSLVNVNFWIEKNKKIPFQQIGMLNHSYYFCSLNYLLWFEYICRIKIPLPILCKKQSCSCSCFQNSKRYFYPNGFGEGGLHLLTSFTCIVGDCSTAWELGQNFFLCNFWAISCKKRIFQFMWKFLVKNCLQTTDLKLIEK